MTKQCWYLRKGRRSDRQEIGDRGMGGLGVGKAAKVLDLEDKNIQALLPAIGNAANREDM